LYFPAVKLILVIYPLNFIFKMMNNIRDITIVVGFQMLTEWVFLLGFDLDEILGFYGIFGVLAEWVVVLECGWPIGIKEVEFDWILGVLFRL
jgi:hypothetical protein